MMKQAGGGRDANFPANSDAHPTVCATESIRTTVFQPVERRPCIRESQTKGFKVEEWKVQGGMFKVQTESIRGYSLHPESYFLTTLSTLPPFTPIGGVINLMARGLHNRRFSIVFAEVFELDKLTTSKLVNFAKL
ncbi:MAG TPA: hypothetical protein VMM56_17740 [Planctomycetaceae bacterium]|nr:hypothetical protein [Planctomycetaceae bacterium]